MNTALGLRILKAMLSALIVRSGGAIRLPADEIVARGLDCVFCPRVDADGHTVALTVRGIGRAAAPPSASGGRWRRTPPAGGARAARPRVPRRGSRRRRPR